MHQLIKLVSLLALTTVTIGQVITQNAGYMPWSECIPDNLQERADGSEVLCVGVTRSGLNKCKSSRTCDILLMVKVTDGSDPEQSIHMLAFVRHPTEGGNHFRTAYISLSNSKAIEYDSITYDKNPLDTVFLLVDATALDQKRAAVQYHDTISNRTITLNARKGDIDTERGPTFNQSGVMYDTAKFKISPIIHVPRKPPPGGDTVKPTLNLLEKVYIHFKIRTTWVDFFLQNSTKALKLTNRYVPTTTTTTTTRRPRTLITQTSALVTLVTAKQSPSVLAYVVSVLALLAIIVTIIFLSMIAGRPPMAEEEKASRDAAVKKYFNKQSMDSVVSNGSLHPVSLPDQQ
ncbi:hypothetical protein HDE_10608 [Halotydeus destructor]|nr:hypothetical protein HDE_10608 [Halotydeus destructor]